MNAQVSSRHLLEVLHASLKVLHIYVGAVACQGKVCEVCQRPKSFKGLRSEDPARIKQRQGVQILPKAAQEGSKLLHHQTGCMFLCCSSMQSEDICVSLEDRRAARHFCMFLGDVYLLIPKAIHCNGTCGVGCFRSASRQSLMDRLKGQVIHPLARWR